MHLHIPLGDISCSSDRSTAHEEEISIRNPIHGQRKECTLERLGMEGKGADKAT